MVESRESGLGIEYRIGPPVTNDEMNALFSVSWSDHESRDFIPLLERSLGYVCAYEGDRLIGFVNVAWDGGVHGFLLDTTVHPELRRRGIGTALVKRAIEVAQGRGLAWLHVDFVPELETFYSRFGFRRTEAGLLEMRP